MSKVGQPSHPDLSLRHERYYIHACPTLDNLFVTLEVGSGTGVDLGEVSGEDVVVGEASAFSPDRVKYLQTGLS